MRAEDLYAIRKAHLRAEARSLEAREAQRAFQELLLEMERRYGLLATDAALDARTGRIIQEAGI